jgi:hypothetical protein
VIPYPANVKDESGRRDSVQPVALVGVFSEEGDAGHNAIPITGALTADDLRSTATRSEVPSTAVSTTILAANPLRKGAAIFNTDANVLYLNIAGGVATVNGIPLAALTGYYEIPFGITNAITGIWAADGSGQATVYEAS